MNEAEWRACQDAWPMLELLRQRGLASARKLRLFAVACCRRTWRLAPPNDTDRSTVFVSERFADGLATREELKAARKRARPREAGTAWLDAFEAARSSANSAAYAVGLLASDSRGRAPFLAGHAKASAAETRLAGEQREGQADLLRDIFSPFRDPVILPAVLAWDGGCAVKLAAGIYEERDFSHERMGVLADALEEAGLTDEEVLRHLRGSGQHCRGCHVIDLFLGKV
jgi:hypothetical protein